jgi:hypothetical protein
MGNIENSGLQNSPRRGGHPQCNGGILLRKQAFVKLRVGRKPSPAEGLPAHDA